MTDAAIERELHSLRGTERRTIARIVERLMQVDERGIYLKRACSNLTRYCIERLGYSERAAGRRVGAARLARLYPCIPDMLRRGDIDLSNLEIVAPVLRQDVNPDRLMQAVGKTRAQLELLVAAWSPKPDVPLRVWEVRVDTRQMRLEERVQERAAGEQMQMHAADAVQTSVQTAVAEQVQTTDAARGCAQAHAVQTSVAGESLCNEDHTLELPPVLPAPRPKALSPGRFAIQFTIDADAHADLEALTGHLRHVIPDGDPAKIIAKALRALRKSVEARKFGRLSAKRAVKKASKERELPLAPLPPAEVAATDRLATAALEVTAPDVEAAAAKARDVNASVIKTLEVTAAQPSAPNVKPPPTGRAAPDRATRREVAERDGYRCCFTSEDGHRCTSTAWLENDHRIRVADGGPTSTANLRLLCRAHNSGREKGIHPQ